MAKESLSPQLPPQNIEAEKSLLGSLMLDQEAMIKVVDSLVDRDFYLPQHQKIFQAMADLFQEGMPIDILSVANRLKEKKQLETVGGRAYLTTLVNSVPTASNVLSYAKIVQKKRILRDLISASYDIQSFAFDESPINSSTSAGRK